MKPNKRELAEKFFASNDIDIVEGHRVLGSVIGSQNECSNFLKEKKDDYAKLLNKLSKHAKTSPQAVYKCYTNGVQHKLTFISRTTPNCESLFEETEKVIKDELIPSLVNHNSYNDKFRDIFALPVREGGLNILQPEDRVDDYTRSKLLSDPLAMNETMNAEVEQERFMQKIRKDKQSYIKIKKANMKKNIDDNTAYALDLAMEKGASCWLNALPLKKYNFDLTKSEFRDGIALRYGWDPVKMPATCACGESFTTSHALHCAKGGYTHMRHNDVRDSIANLLDEVCHDVEVEPCLQPLQGESFANKTTSTDDDARLDIKANGLWESRYHRTFFDVKIFNPHAKSCSKDINEAYKNHEDQKKRKYEQRVIDIEKATFTPLVFSCTRGAGPSAAKTIKRIAGKG